MTSQTPLVTVVIACYNQAHYLGEAIESVLAQTYRNFEIIVVDDGSRDNPAEVAARYQSVRFIRQENQGTAAATRNTGFRAGKGAYLVFLDADDRLLPNALEAGAATLITHPKAGLTIGNFYHITADGSRLAVELWPKCTAKGEDHYLALLRWEHLWEPLAVMFRRQAFESVGGFNASPRIKGCDDHDICLRIGKDFPFYCHNETIAEYRLHDSNTSRNLAMMLRAAMTVFQFHQKSARASKRRREAHREGRQRCREYYGEQIIEDVRRRMRKGGEWKQALEGVLTLAQYYPRGFVKHAGRKFYCVVFRVESDFAE